MWPSDKIPTPASIAERERQRAARERNAASIAYRSQELGGRVVVGPLTPGELPAAGIVPLAYGPRWQLEIFAEVKNSI